jgi:hypothetical protein
MLMHIKLRMRYKGKLLEACANGHKFVEAEAFNEKLNKFLEGI